MLVLVLVLVAPALADDDLERALFTDLCLEKPAEAEADYVKALDARPPLPASEWARATYALARVRALDGRTGAAQATLERLAERAGDRALLDWPERAREALDRLAGGENPFDPGARWNGPVDLAAAAVPIEDVLRKIAGEHGISFVLDPSTPGNWTVSVALEGLTFDEFMDALAGRGNWRRMGDAVAIGKIAADGEAWERRWSWADVKNAADRRLGVRLCANRVSGVLRGDPAEAASWLAEWLRLSASEWELTLPADRTATVRAARIIASDLRADRALDLLCVPLDLEWVVKDGKLVVQPRKERAR